MPSTSDPLHDFNIPRFGPNAVVERWHIHVDAKTYGPYNLNQIAQMVERRQIIGSDMVCAHGGSGWVKAEKDPVLGTLFRAQKHITSEPEPPVRAIGAHRHWVNILLGGIAVISVLWISWPYYAAHSLFIAFRDGDVSVLEDRVAWDSVRQGLRGDLSAIFLEQLKDLKENSSDSALGTGIAVVLAPTIINQLVDGYVTPQAIAAKRTEPSSASVKENDEAGRDLSKAVQEARQIRWNQVQYAFFSGGPLTFKINFLPEHDPPLQSPVTLLFKWSGDWKLTRVQWHDAFNQFIEQQKATSQASDTAITNAAEPSPLSPPPEESARDQQRKAATGTEDKRKDVQSQIDALRAQVRALWSPPVGVQNPNELIVNVTIKLRPDGRLAAPPVARVNGSSVAAMASRDSAVRAVLTGQPFDMLKPEHYESWKEIELTFDPKDMFRSN